MVHNPTHKRFTVNVRNYPVEKVTLDRTVDPCRSKGFTREKPLRIVFGHLHYSDRDTLRDDHEECVLEPKRVRLDLPPIYEFQEIRPKLTLESYGCVVLQLVP
jgi:hypothetical protein